MVGGEVGWRCEQYKDLRKYQWFGTSTSIVLAYCQGSQQVLEYILDIGTQDDLSKYWKYGLKPP